jgi:UDP-N-acetylglucosamine 2-epimerase (non-hydrolysing)
LQLGLKKNQESGCRDYAVVTLHRPSNVDSPDTFQGILEALSTVAKELPILFPVHPRTMNRIKAFCLEHYFHSMTRSSGMYCLEALGYLDFLCLLSHAKLVLTDSGGLQEETTVLDIPCVTLRQNTERPVTITHGTNALAGTRKEDIISHAFNQLSQPLKLGKPPLWDGHAGRRIIEILTRQINEHS